MNQWTRNITLLERWLTWKLFSINMMERRIASIAKRRLTRKICTTWSSMWSGSQMKRASWGREFESQRPWSVPWESRERAAWRACWKLFSSCARSRNNLTRRLNCCACTSRPRSQWSKWRKMRKDNWRPLWRRRSCSRTKIFQKFDVNSTSKRLWLEIRENYSTSYRSWTRWHRVASHRARTISRLRIVRSRPSRFKSVTRLASRTSLKLATTSCRTTSRTAFLQSRVRAEWWCKSTTQMRWQFCPTNTESSMCQVAFTSTSTNTTSGLRTQSSAKPRTQSDMKRLLNKKSENLKEKNN